MRSWIQALLRGVGDVHELDAERLAIGAAQDGDDLAHRREFEAEHLVEEDLAVEVGFGEAVGLRDRARPRSAPAAMPSGSSLAWKWPRMR